MSINERELSARRASGTVDLPAQASDGPWALDVGWQEGAETKTLTPGERVVIGSGCRADLRVSDRAVSACHARLVATGRGVELEDLGSRNGVYVGGARISSATLAGGACSFVLGRTTVVVRPLQEDDDTTDDAPDMGGLVGSSAPMRRLRASVRRLAPLRGPVLIRGESGSGKDVVAHCLHRESGRPGHFVPINVAAIAETLADAELFGHRKGAFTGAVTSRVGAFEAADRGTLFLDEIADLPAAMQVKLLRVVEDGAVRPVGAVEPTPVDARIVSATWADLSDRVRAGGFRQDLLHRITTFVIEVPPLRHRKNDIPALAAALLGRLRDELGDKQLSSAALAKLVAHQWPGNVRELGSVLYRAAALAPRDRIEAAHVDRALGPSARRPVVSLSARDARGLLDAHGGNITRAARAAGVARSTFRAWLKRS